MLHTAELSRTGLLHFLSYKRLWFSRYSLPHVSFSLNLLLSLPVLPNSSAECLSIQFPTQSVLLGELPPHVPPADLLWSSPGGRHSSQPGNPFSTFLPWCPTLHFQLVLLFDRIYMPGASSERQFETEKFWDSVCLEISLLCPYAQFARTWHCKWELIL